MLMHQPCRISGLLTAALFTALLPTTGLAADAQSITEQIRFSGSHAQTVELAAGQTLEISAGVVSPSQLPANGRLAAEWIAPSADGGFRKVLHALDPDVYVVY